jgi:uncharacterized protein
MDCESAGLLPLLARQAEPTGAELVAWALDRLEHGFESPSIVRLAGESQNASLSDTRPLFEKALEENRIEVPEKPELVRRYIRQLAREFPQSGRTPHQMLSFLADSVGRSNLLELELRVWFDLEDGLDLSKGEPWTEADFHNEFQSAIQRWSDWTPQKQLFVATEFVPFFANGHAATIAGNFWKRPEILAPETISWFQAADDVKILVITNRPHQSHGHALVLMHGLEGTGNSGYMRSLAALACAAGFTVHRCHMRGCGSAEAESSSKTMYHAGLTADLKLFLESLDQPTVLVGFSLGGNVVLKLTGESGAATKHLKATVAVSVPADLSACVDRLAAKENLIYSQRFLQRLRQRVIRRNQFDPKAFPLEPLPKVKTIRDFDNFYVAPYFGFGDATNYYATQSAQNFVPHIERPTLVIQAKDDPLIPFSVFQKHGWSNPHIQLLATEHGGHMGFLAKRQPRFWLDQTILDWAAYQLNIV